MEIAQKIIDWHQLLSRQRFEEFLRSSAEKVEIHFEQSEFYQDILDGDGWVSYAQFADSEEGERSKWKLFGQFEKDLHGRFNAMIADTYFFIINRLFVLESKDSKEQFVSDVYVLLKTLFIDVFEWQAPIISRLTINDPFSHHCNLPYELRYIDQVKDGLIVVNKLLEQRFSTYIPIAAHNTVKELEANSEKLIMFSWEEANRNYIPSKTKSPFSLMWDRTDSDLIELVTALSIAECVKTPSGKVSRTQLANAFASIFGLEKFTESTITDRANKNLKRKIESAKFLVDLLEAYKTLSDQKKKIPQKKSNS